MNGQPILWRILLTTLLVGLILAVANLLVTTLSVLLLVLAGILFGIFLNGLTGWLARYVPLSYAWCYATVVVLLLALAAGGTYYMGSQAVQRASALSGQLREATRQLTSKIQQSDRAQQLLSGKNPLKKATSNLGGMLAGAAMGVRWLLWGITGIVVIFFVGVYTAYDPSLYRSGLIKLIPADRRERAGQVLHALQSTLGYWIAGRLLSMSIVAILTAVALWLLKVPLPVTLGVIAGLLTFIPNIGPVLAAVPQALLAMKVGPSTVVYVIVFNIALQAVESYLITPIVQRYAVTLPPAMTIIVQLLLGVVAGVIGLVMAAPLTAAVMLLVQMLYIKDRLGDPAPGQLAERM